MTTMKALFFFACLGASTVAAAPAGPTSVVAAFYRADLAKGNIDAYLAADTVKLLNDANKANKSGKLVLDYDPFCGCQVGMYGAQPSSPTVAGNVATVPVRVLVGLSKARAGYRPMKVVLHRIDGRWQIWDFIAIDGKKANSFRAQTLKALSYSHKNRAR